MGWAAGSSLGKDIYEKIREYIPEKDRKQIATFIYDYVCDQDADDWTGDSQLEIDADVDYYCNGCDREMPISKLDDQLLCKDCGECNC